MQAEPYLSVILAGALLVLLAAALDHVWAATLPARTLYYILRLPGVVVHECSHVLGCILTGAKVEKVVLFSREGGSVTYTRPLLPWLGDVVISTAPLFCIPLVLAGTSWAFSTYLGCILPPFAPGPFSPGTLWQAGPAVAGIFYLNLVSHQNGWFLLYLYLTTSLVLSIPPSLQDVKNAAVGIFLLLLACSLVLLSGNALLNGALSQVALFCGAGLLLGLSSGLVALAVSLPLVAYYLYQKIR